MKEDTVGRYDSVAANIGRVREEIDAACRAAGRDAGEVALLPVTKFHPVEGLAAVQRAGIRAVGENRAGEAEEKKRALHELSFHMIGKIQSKKTTSIVRWADCVHSVDSVKVARRLVDGMQRAHDLGERVGSEILSCLVQISADGDPARGGAAPEQIAPIVDILENGAYTRFDGLMCVPPLDADPQGVFEAVSELVAQWAQRVGRPLEFSAGMSADMREAILAGSTIVRVGTAIMGPRPVT